VKELAMANYTREFNQVCFSLNKKYRSHIEIIALILEALKYCTAARYSLMKHTSVNYSQLTKYLKLLGKMGFIEAQLREGKVVYRTSELGLSYLRQYNVLRDMLLDASSRNRATEFAHEKYSMPAVDPHTSIPFATQFVKRR
jgi:predicted transcriptional regulator